MSLQEWTEAEVEAVLEGSARKLLDHPLARRYAINAESSHDLCIFTPGEVLGERLARVGALLMILHKRPDFVEMNVADEHKRLFGLKFAGLAMTADPYLWSEEVRTALRHSSAIDADGQLQLPRHVVSPKLLPSPRMWWTFETGIDIATKEQHGVFVTVDGMLVHDHGDSFAVYTHGEISHDGTKEIEQEMGREAVPFVQRELFKYGLTYPEDYDRSDHRSGSFPTVLSYLAFLNSPYIPKQRGRLSRPERREIARSGATDNAGEEITFITLRRPEPRHKDDEADDHDVAWKHRWIVSGHYRAQWYPREQAHHVIWIAPYLKGPEDAPMIEHAYKVAR